jgi:hypothetical protein
MPSAARTSSNLNVVLLELWSITVGFGLLIVYNYIYQKLYCGDAICLL